MRRLTLVLIMLILALSLAMTGCRQPVPQPPTTEKPVTPQPPVQPPGTTTGGEGVGKPVPDFTVTDVDGKTHRAGDYKGQVLVLDFWATYCKACVKKLGEYSIEQTFKRRDVAMLALSMDEEDAVIRGWRKQQGDEFTIPLARLDDATRKAFFGDTPIVEIPQVRVVDRKGIVRYSFGPGSTVQELKDAVETLLQEQ